MFWIRLGTGVHGGALHRLAHGGERFVEPAFACALHLSTCALDGPVQTFVYTLWAYELSNQTRFGHGSQHFSQ